MPAYGHLDRHSKPRLGWPVLYPGWAAARRLPRRGPHLLRPGAPLRLPPGWAGAFPSQAGPSRHRSPPAPRFRFCPGWAFSPMPRRSPASRLGRPRRPRLGRGLLSPGWAASPPDGPASQQAKTPPGQRPSGRHFMGQAGIPLSRLGWPLCCIPAKMGRDSHSPGRIIALLGRNSPPPTYFLVQHRL
jgi:hypothetical protein